MEAETLGGALEREHREIDRAIETYLASVRTFLASGRMPDGRVCTQAAA